MDIESYFIIIILYISSISLYLTWNNKVDVNLFRLLFGLFSFFSFIFMYYIIIVNNLLEWNYIIEFFYRSYKKIEKNISISNIHIKFI